MSFYRKQLGAQGEIAAGKFLQKCGYEIIKQNYSNAIGEIDIIARDKQELVFVEVKTRKNDNFGLPVEAVNRIKKKKLFKTAQAYLSQYKLEDISCRFDVVSVKIEADNFNIELIKNVF